MKTIITDNSERECINMISTYLDIDYVKEKIVQSYSHLSAQKQKSVSESIRFYITQGLELYSDSNTSINTIPLTLFYSLNNFIKAVYLLKNPNLSLSGSHGIALKSEELDKASNIGETIIHFTKNGTFSNLLQITNDSINYSDIVLLKDLFALLPELRELFFLSYSEEPNVFLLQEKKGDSGQFNVMFQSNEMTMISTKNLSMMTKNGYHLETFQNNHVLEGHLFLTQNSYEKENNVIYFDSFGNKYCTTGININGNMIKISKISIIYICYYVFSMFVRYCPHLWMKFCNSKDISLISKLMTGVKNISLIEILQLLNNEQYMFACKMPDLDRDLDYSDLLKNLLKEVKLENRRYGKSILSNYI